MAWTKRAAVRILSVFYLLALTILGAYALYKIRDLSLPISQTLTAFALALPTLAGLIVEFLFHSSASSPLQKLRITNGNHNGNGNASPHPRRVSWPPLALVVVTILETVLATLAGSHLPTSDTQTCTLDTRWRSLFRAHNGRAIQRIQDTLNCCGLHSTRDMAFPFPSKNVGADGCERAFGRTQSCFAGWREDERGVAGVVLGIVVGVAVWKVLILSLQARNTSWFSHFSQIVIDDDTEDQTNNHHGSLEYQGSGPRYLDQPPAAVEEEIDDSQDGRAVEDALIHSRVQPSQLRDESEQWASERRD